MCFFLPSVEPIIQTMALNDPYKTEVSLFTYIYCFLIAESFLLPFFLISPCFLHIFFITWDADKLPLIFHYKSSHTNTFIATECCQYSWVSRKKYYSRAYIQNEESIYPLTVSKISDQSLSNSSHILNIWVYSKSIHNDSLFFSIW